jgi:hypothetical protein
MPDVYATGPGPGLRLALQFQSPCRPSLSFLTLCPLPGSPARVADWRGSEGSAVRLSHHLSPWELKMNPPSPTLEVGKPTLPETSETSGD